MNKTGDEEQRLMRTPNSYKNLMQAVQGKVDF